MVCPFCLYKKTEIFNSRAGARLNATWRRRRCTQCSAQFTTYESADPGSILSVKAGRDITPYSHNKLLLELAQVCDHRVDIDESVPYLTGTIEQKLFRKAAEGQERAITKAAILSATLETLQHYDTVAYVKYASRHQKNVNEAALRKALKRG